MERRRIFEEIINRKEGRDCEIHRWTAQAFLEEVHLFISESQQEIIDRSFGERGKAQGKIIRFPITTGAVACGVNAQMIPENDDLDILWIYACNSARRIAMDLAKRGVVTLGFATEVLVGDESLPTEIGIAQNCVSELTEVEPLDLFCRLRKGFYDSAKESLRRKDITGKMADLQMAIF